MKISTKNRNLWFWAYTCGCSLWKSVPMIYTNTSFNVYTSWIFSKHFSTSYDITLQLASMAYRRTTIICSTHFVKKVHTPLLVLSVSITLEIKDTIINSYPYIIHWVSSYLVALIYSPYKCMLRAFFYGFIICQNDLRCEYKSIHPFKISPNKVNLMSLTLLICMLNWREILSELRIPI